MLEKQEYPPILPLGFHLFDLPGLRSLCVDGFPESQTRNAIMTGLEGVIQRMRDVDLQADIWVDGSFMTRKIDPADSDIVVRIDGVYLQTSTPQQKEVVSWIQSDLTQTHYCDSYFFVSFPDGHPNYTHGIWRQSYWIKQFGFSRSLETKGMALLRVP